MSIMKSLAKFGTELQWSDLDHQTSETAKQAILDACGNILSGRYHAEAAPVLKYTWENEIYPAEQKGYPLPGERQQKYSLRGALFAAAVMGRLADMDDGFTRAMGHPGSLLVPTLLLCGASEQISGKEALTALTAAYEIYARIGEAVNPSMHRERGFDATGVCGAVAAAFLIARLRKLSCDEMVNAMGLAASFSGGLIESQIDGTSGKYLCGAWGAVNGLQSVQLAQSGFTGPVCALEGKAGLIQGFRGSGSSEPERILEGLGNSFKINEVYFKRYACLRGVHGAMDAVRSLKEAWNLTPNQVASLDIRASEYLMRLSRPEPETLVAAQGSLQLTSAAILCYGEIAAASSLMEYMDDPEIREMMKKIKVTADEEMQHYYKSHPEQYSACKVVLTTTDGKQLTEYRYLPDGEEKGKRFGWTDLENKFCRLMEKTPDAGRSEERIKKIRNLENEHQIGNLLI